MQYATGLKNRAGCRPVRVSAHRPSVFRKPNYLGQRTFYLRTHKIRSRVPVDDIDVLLVSTDAREKSRRRNVNNMHFSGRTIEDPTDSRLVICIRAHKCTFEIQILLASFRRKVRGKTPSDKLCGQTCQTNARRDDCGRGEPPV